MDISQVESDIHTLISQKNYPCIAAVQALFKKELICDIYTEFGSGLSARSLAKNLIEFKERQRSQKIQNLTYFAAFPEDIVTNEEDFEDKLWRELSAMWDHSDIVGGWDPAFSDDPADKNFCFSLDGSAYFVVGLHSQSSRLSRRLPYPALVFNLYSQFHELQEQGLYQSMIQINRQRDERFQGSVNPMAAQHNDVWEAIQFSGRNNPSDWQCPFTKGLLGLAKKAWFRA
ncbi:guanitoxin biosynthesis heme-dependent pre-guanitoxin N-hydroxylase GntA [Bdellovibrio sp. ArHS]|uniref:guanitoxin biosynthesis heme-dependent pre-guanitoxin N-hydroxylase GntA n=1 Tax=Bdellovibrio sp. ArHS TaxID=1569284 RepID=UPI000B283C34|nr:guanitoxin biosynthesis heme-dependent pre-guanitoxin N-hydroxylase GntA [Bdellovibrio sp. ArHS]